LWFCWCCTPEDLHFANGYGMMAGLGRWEGDAMTIRDEHGRRRICPLRRWVCPWEQTKLTVHRRDANNAHHLSRSYLLHLDHNLREKREHGSLPISQLAANMPFESNGDEHDVASDRNSGWLADFYLFLAPLAFLLQKSRTLQTKAPIPFASRVFISTPEETCTPARKRS
jgi:hypothetical protein